MTVKEVKKTPKPKTTIKGEVDKLEKKLYEQAAEIYAELDKKYSSRNIQNFLIGLLIVETVISYMI